MKKFLPIAMAAVMSMSAVAAVSYTHLDVYKRQGLDLKQFSDIRAYFMTLREKYIK